jgi:hypothetical protein
MGTVCHACGYERKSTDQAPDWECPACGKAYVKTSHEQGDPVSGFVPGFAAGVDNRLGSTPAYQPMSGGSTSNNAKKPNIKYGIFGGLLGVLFIWGIPILSNPSSASAILLHGDVGFIGAAVLAVWGIIVVARRLSANVDMNSPSSRFAFFGKFLALFCTVFFALLIMWARNEEHTEVKIQANGQRVMADVVRIYTGSCGKRSCSINVEYAFTPSSETGAGSQAIHGYAQLGTSDRSNAPNLVYARTNQHVPVAYEVDHPQVSALNFNDDVFRIDHSRRYLSTVRLFGEIFLGIFVIGLLVGGLSLWLTAGNQSNPG